MNQMQNIKQSVSLDRGNAHNLARALGWFSLALGAAEVMAPKTLSRWLGMRDGAALLQAYGARELLAGAGILASSNPTPWVWSRVGGDAIDIVTLMTGFRDDNPNNANVGVALGAVLGVTLADVICAGSLQEERRERRERRRNFVAAYKSRSGFRRPVEAMRGAARDFVVPRDMGTPPALQPYH